MMAAAEMQKKLGDVFNDRQAGVLTDVIHAAYSDLVRTGDFDELKSIVRDLATAQERTEHRLEELATAQERTEHRLEQLIGVVETLAVSQERLATAHEGIERRLGSLSRQVGGLSDRLGGDLEDAARTALPDVLARERGWQVAELSHTWQQWNGQEEEVDLFGQAHDPARPEVTIWIVAEVKFNLTARDLRRFAQKVTRARRHLQGEVFPVVYCFRIYPAVQRAVVEAGLYIVFAHGRLL